jgi:hypothetical protein
MADVFIGSESLARGLLTRHELRRWYKPIFKDVYVPSRAVLTLENRSYGAWLWSRRRAVIAGVAASALHWASWVDDTASIELIWRRSRKHDGLVVRQESLEVDEVMHVAGLPVTTPARTAFDLGRHLPRGEALARMDALMRAAPYSLNDVFTIAKRHEAARGVRQLRELLPRVDGGAASPQETRLRLLFIDSGFPKPTTQIPAVEAGGRLVRMLDMGWEDFMVAAEYDGDHHRTNRSRYVKDLRALPKLQALGWIVVRVIKEDKDDDVVRRAYRAMTSRGWKPARPIRAEFNATAKSTRHSAA